MSFHVLFLEATASETIVQVERATWREPHLLSQSFLMLRQLATAGQLVVARDELDQFLCYAALWPLASAEAGADWFELGSLAVAPKSDAQVRLAVASELSSALLERFVGANIVVAATDPATIKVCRHLELVHLSSGRLPEHVRASVCTCPRVKTGQSNVRRCYLRDYECAMFVSRPTWSRLERPHASRLPRRLAVV